MSHKHPITGEDISFGQHVSWKIQSAIRHWWFILTITAISVACWIYGASHPSELGWWNAWASYMALFIESVVGISMYQQTRADAAVIRKILAMETNQFEELKDLITRVETDLEIMHYPDHQEQD